MKVTYTAHIDEMTELATLLKTRYRGQMQVRFTDAGVEVQVETGDPRSVEVGDGGWELAPLARAA